jgi:NADPH:quinone reductase-like Zn-dependent oxidoreductase
MKAIIYTKYGPPDVLEMKEIAKPAPKDNEVLIKVNAASLNAADWHLLRADPFLARLFAGLFKPKFNILGADIAGRVEAAGRNVKQFQPGDEVFGDIAGCGWGGLAEYVCANENYLALKPSNLSLEESAAVPLAAVTALQAIRDKGNIKPGQTVLINGASGGVGTYAVQIAKSFGAEVTAVCSTGKLDTVRSLGADHAIDYTKEDFTKNGKLYDLIIGANGYHPIKEYRSSLSSNGTYVMTGGTGAQMFEALVQGPLISMTGKRKMGGLSAEGSQKDLLFVKGLIESGKVKPVIDKRYPLEKTADAFRYLEEGHARGKIVINIE